MNKKILFLAFFCLFSSYSVFSATSQFVNGDFSSGLSGWDVYQLGGYATETDGHAVIGCNNVACDTSIRQYLTVSDSSSSCTMSFDYTCETSSMTMKLFGPGTLYTLIQDGSAHHASGVAITSPLSNIYYAFNGYDAPGSCILDNIVNTCSDDTTTTTSTTTTTEAPTTTTTIMTSIINLTFNDYSGSYFRCCNNASCLNIFSGNTTEINSNSTCYNVKGIKDMELKDIVFANMTYIVIVLAFLIIISVAYRRFKNG